MAAQKAYAPISFTTTAVIFLVAIECCLAQNNSENLQVLEIIEKSLNTSASPCDSFYNYACGNWAKHFATEDILEITTLLNIRFEDAVEDVINSKYPDQKFINLHKQNFIDKTLAYYYSCTNRGTLYLVKYIREIKLGHDFEWPLLKEWMDATTSDTDGSRNPSPHQALDIFALLGSLHSYNFNNVLISLAFKMSNASLHVQIQMPESTNLAAESVHRILESLGFPKHANSRLTQELLDMDNYWQSSYQQYSSYNDGYNTTFGEIQYLYPSLAKFLGNVFSLHIQSDDLVFFRSLSYVEFLVGHKWQPHEMAKLSNYLLVKFLLYLKENQEEKCITSLRRKMPLAVNYMYYGHIYLRESKQFNANITSLIQMIHKHFLKSLDKNRLQYTPLQSQRLRQKIGEMVFNVGNLPENVSYSQVDLFYSDVPDLVANNFYKNDLLLLKHQFIAQSICLKHMVCHPAMDSSPINYGTLNLVVIPLASLQLPMYHYQLHPLFTLSLLGFVIGHEFTHAIDPGTIGMDTDHFSPVTSPYYNSSLECMKAQHYTNFINERVADFVGAHVAYQAYHDDFHFQPAFTQIPWQQLFFLNLAQFYCGNNKAFIHSHDTDEVRLNQIAMNSEEFSQAFQCPSGSNMNPLKKCPFY